jgi:DNA-binding Xre family transcriptional regulator
MVMIPPMPIKWKLRAILEENALSVRDLAREIERRGGKTSEITLYRINGRGGQIQPKGIDVLEDVILGLESLTSKTFNPNDLLEVVRDA